MRWNAVRPLVVGSDSSSAGEATATSTLPLSTASEISASACQGRSARKDWPTGPADLVDESVQIGQPRQRRPSQLHLDEPYARQVAALFPDAPEVLENVMEGLFDLGITGRDWIEETGAEVGVNEFPGEEDEKEIA